MAYQHPDPFWEFIRSFEPNSAGPNNGPSPEFLRGFPFFNPAHAHHGGHPHHHGPGGRHRPHRGPPHDPRGPPHGPHGPAPHPWAGPFAWADWTTPSHEGSPWFQQQQPQQEEQQSEQTKPQQQQEQQKAQKAQQEERENEKPGSPDTMMGDSDVPDPAEVTPDEDEGPESNDTNPPPHPRGHCRRGGGRHRGRRGHNHEGPFPFDLSALFSTLSSHPFVQNLQQQAAEVAKATTSVATNASPTGAFSPPLDLFSAPSAYILHLAIPGALKSDIGVDWDPERNVLRVAGVVHRPGDEEFQNMLVQGERRVGEFQREVRLPPKTWGAIDENGREDEIDADGITAKMENGVLVVTVPKVEKEWTEIRKVDIE